MTPLRHVTTALAAASVLLLAAGCGSDDAPESTAYVLTDLDGGKIPVAPGDPLPTTSPTSTAPSSPASPPASSDSPEPGVGIVTGQALVDRVSAAVGALESVHVSGGSSTSTVLEADHRYGGGGDAFDAELTLAGAPVDVRRAGGVLYLDAGDGFVPVDPASPDNADVAGGLLPAFLDWNPLADLRGVLLGAGEVTEGGPDDIDGVAVTSYTFPVDLGDLPEPSTVVPGSAPDTAQATLSLDADDRPVRLDLDLGTATARVGYSDWGAPVVVDDPAAS